MSEYTDMGFVAAILDKQDRGEEITPAEHRKMLELIDRRIAGMDGFRYCWPEVARLNRQLIEKQMTTRAVAVREFLKLTDGMF